MDIHGYSTYRMVCMVFHGYGCCRVPCYGFDGRAELTSWAKPGAKCVCIDNTRHPQLNIGQTYTIVAVESDDPSVLQAGTYAGSKVLVELAEVKNWSAKPSYAVERFRPIITQQDDVERFRHLLSPSPLQRLDLLASNLNEACHYET